MTHSVGLFHWHLYWHSTEAGRVQSDYSLVYICLKFQNMFVKIAKYICPNCKMYLSKLWNVFVHRGKGVAQTVQSDYSLVWWNLISIQWSLRLPSVPAGCWDQLRDFLSRYILLINVHIHIFFLQNPIPESQLGIWPSQDIFIRNQIHTLVFLKSHFPINMKTVRNWNLSSTFTFQLIWIRVWCENWHLSSDHWVRLPMMLMITNQFRKGNHVETFRLGGDDERKGTQLMMENYNCV